MRDVKQTIQIEQAIDIPSGKIRLEGELKLPQGANGVVLFAHGSGSSRHSPRNQFVAQVIRDAGVGTLLFDLLTKQEEAIDAYTGRGLPSRAPEYVDLSWRLSPLIINRVLQSPNRLRRDSEFAQHLVPIVRWISNAEI